MGSSYPFTLSKTLSSSRPSAAIMCLTMHVTDEEWRPILGWEDLYEISNFGRVRSYHSRSRGGFLKPFPAGAGYLQVRLCAGSEDRERSYIHQLVAWAFLNPPPIDGRLYEPNHKNGIKTDNRAENLEWRTHAENLQHANDTQLRSVERRGRKLTDEQVRLIRATSPEHDSRLAAQLGVARTVLWRIHRNLAYRDVPS